MKIGAGKMIGAAMFAAGEAAVAATASISYVRSV